MPVLSFILAGRLSIPVHLACWVWCLWFCWAPALYPLTFQPQKTLDTPTPISSSLSGHFSSVIFNSGSYKKKNWHSNLSNSHSLTVLEAEKSRIRVPTPLFPGRALLLASQLLSHCVLRNWRERKLWSLFSLLPSQGPTLISSSKLNDLPKARLQISTHWELGLQHVGLDTTAHSVRSTVFELYTLKGVPCPTHWMLIFPVALLCLLLSSFWTHHLSSV